MSSNFLYPVVQESTPALIARQLRRAIGQGELVPGQRMNETELSRSLGVGRGPLREAMQRLTQEGLLISIRNKGVFVIDVTDGDVRDMYLARTAVERAAAARAIQLDPEGTAERLLEVVESMTTAVGGNNIDALTEADIAFHALLVSQAGSPRLSRMHTTLMVETRMCITALETHYPSHTFRLDEHREITHAIRQSDVERVDRLLLEHMEDALGRLAPVKR